MLFSEYMSLNLFFLRILGLWSPFDESEVVKNKIYNIYSHILFLMFLSLHCAFLLWNIYFIFNDMELLALVCFVVLIKVTALVKYGYFLRYSKIIKELVKSTEKDVFQPKLPQQEENMNASYNIWNFVYKSFLISGTFTMASWMLTPVFLDKIKDRGLPFLAHYPFDAKPTPFYQLMYFHQCFSLLIVGGTNINVDNFISGSLTFIGVQCEILTDFVKEITGPCKVDWNTFENNENFPNNDNEEKLLACVNRHREILKFAKSTGHLFSVTVAVQFTASILSGCMTLFQLSLATVGGFKFFSLITYELAILIEVLTYCWFSNEVIEKSSKIPYAAFQTCWYKGSEAFKKNLKFFIHRTQKPITMYALRYFGLSIKTFVWIMQTSFSYFAVLRQVYARSD